MQYTLLQHFHSRDAFSKVGREHHATLHTRQVLDYGIRSTMANRFGQVNVTVMDECFSPVDIALGLRRRSPFRYLV